MELTRTYKRVLVILVLLLAGWVANAQHYVVVNSVRAFKVPNNAILNHSYHWEIFEGTDIKEINRVKSTKIGEEYVLGLSGNNDIVSQEPKIRWSKGVVTLGGVYTVILTEINDISGCNRIMQTKIHIVETPLSVDFKTPKSEYKVVDVTREKFEVPFKFTVADDAVGEDWKKKMLKKSLDSKFKVKFKITYHSNTLKREWNIEKEIDADLFEFVYNNDIKEVLYGLTPFREDNSTDHYFEFEIIEVKDAYDADVKFPKDTKYIFGAYKKPDVTKINHKK